MSRRLTKRTGLLLLVLLFIILGNFLLVGWDSPENSQTIYYPNNYPIEIIPDQLALTGDVTTASNCSHPTVCSWLKNTPAGTIMLGVDPASPDPAHWNGGAITADIFLEDVHVPTVLVLKLTWPVRDGKGLHSPQKGQMGMITLDGNYLWGKSTTRVGTFGDYYAAQYEPILTTIVLTQSGNHSISFSVTEQTVWDLSLIELIAYPYPSTVRGIGYSPFRDCQGPDTALQPTTEDIEEDLFMLFHTSNAVRTYAAGGVNGLIPPIANELGLPVYAGAWIDANPLDLPKEYQADRLLDDAEVAALTNLAHTTDLAGVIVGNEYYLRNRSNQAIDELKQRIIQVRTGINDPNVPITTAEIDNLTFNWQNGLPTNIRPEYRPILDELDFVLVHIYPFWNGMSIEGAAAFTVNRYLAIRKIIEQEYPGKRVIIGETGWPSAVDPNEEAVPSLENQRQYMLEFMILAEQEGVEYMFFDAFDELWKVEEPGLAGQNWGYSYSDRKAKHSFYGVLLPGELLPDPQQTVFHSTDSSFHSYGNLQNYLPYIANNVERREPFLVYTEWLLEAEHFASSGWMGDIENIELYECDRTNPHSGDLSIRVTYTPTGTLGWAGVYWQHPPNNWGEDESEGHDLTGAKRLEFWVRSEKGGEVVEFLVGGIEGDFGDTIQPALTTGPIVLSDTWKPVAISLSDADLSHVIGGFAWVASRCHNLEPITFFIDDIAFDFNFASLPPSLPEPEYSTFYVYEDANSGCNHFVPSGFMGDINDVTLDEAHTESPCGGTTAIEITYGAQGPNGWAGVYWQEPENNWGAIPDAGYNLDQFNALVFCAKGASGGEYIEFGAGGLGRDTQTCVAIEPHPDSTCKISEEFVLTEQWEEYTIDLTNADLESIIGGYLWVAEQTYNPNGAVFYLDNIRYESNYQFPPTPTPTPTPAPTSSPPPSIFYVYEDQNSPNNHFVSSGWMGDINDITFDDNYTADVCGGMTAIEVSYSAQGTNGWSGIYWQEPENNWGTVPSAGFDLSQYNNLVFCAKGETGGELIEFGMGGIGYDPCVFPNAPYPDSTCKISQQIILTDHWSEYSIVLTGHDLSYIIGGFLWVAARSSNPSGATFYLDNIRFESGT